MMSTGVCPSAVSLPSATADLGPVDGLPGVLKVAASAFDTAFGVTMAIGAAVMVVTAAATWLRMREQRPRAS